MKYLCVVFFVFPIFLSAQNLSTQGGALQLSPSQNVTLDIITKLIAVSRLELAQKANWLRRLGDYQQGSELWRPATAMETNDYFLYHKMEVIEWMILFREELGFQDLSIEKVKSWGALHDLPKIMPFEDLKQLGYKGWPREIALKFLSAVFDIPLEILDKVLPKLEYLEVDLSTRLFFSFGLSLNNVEDYFAEEWKREVVRAEVKLIAADINQAEDARKEQEVHKHFRNNKSDLLRLRILEHMADFVVRTENPLSVFEYGKIFIRSSYLLTDTQKENFLWRILAKEGGEEFVKLPMESLVSSFLRMEKAYVSVLSEKVVFHSQGIENERLISQRFVKLIREIHSKAKSCHATFDNL